METPVAVEERFRSNDLKLLETGQYSDAQITVGDRIWKVHKSIICQRSGYLAEVSFRTAKDGEPIPEELPFGTTEKLAELLLEFIYSGGIANIDDLSMADCVELSILGENFRVDGMVSYATKNLWDRLSPTLQCFSTMPGANLAPERLHGCKLAVADMMFELDFRTAVSKAYSHPDNACQLLLADFVSAAPNQFLGTPAMVVLHKAHPLFGTHVFTAMNMGPQSSLLRLNRTSLLCFCFECSWWNDNRTHPKHALQVSERGPFAGSFPPSQNTHKEAV